MTQTDLADMETSYPTLNIDPSVECGRGEVKLRPVRSMSAQSRVTSSLCRLEIPHWYRSNRSVSTTPSPPSWRREGRSRESSWRRRGGTQSEAGERPQSGALTPLGAHSAGTSRDSSTVRGHGGHRWSTYDPASAGVSPGLMTSSYHSCQDSSMARDKEDSGNMSTVRSTNSYLSYRQPYMGWRSLERLKLSGQSCLTPEQRLAASLLNQGQQCLVKLAAAAGADK